MSRGTLAKLGGLDGMPSLPSLRRFIAARPDFPVIQRGQYGTPYIFDLDQAATFVRANWRDGRRCEPRSAPPPQLSLFEEEDRHDD